MSISITGVFEDGIDEFISKKALALVGLFVLVSALGSIAGDTLGLAALDSVVESAKQQGTQFSAEETRQLEDARGEFAWGLGIGIGPAIALLATSFLVGEFVRIGAIRALADRNADWIEPRHYKRNVLSIFINRIIVAILTAILLVVAAFAFLLVPALIFPLLALLGVIPFLYVVIGLYFASFAVTIDEVGPLDGIQRSWELANGHRLVLVVITIGVGVVILAMSIPNFLFLDLEAASAELQTTMERTPLALAASVVVGGVQSVFRLAIASQTYVHLDRGSQPVDGPETGAVDSWGNDDQF